MQAALFNVKMDDRVQCRLCPHHCVLKEGGHGLCKMRRMVNGHLWAAGYGLISSAHLDPVEKKPLYHFYPGSDVFSIGGWGCNFSCDFCQNWRISQKFAEAVDAQKPEFIIDAAIMKRAVGIAYTYNEPLINIEFVYDCAKLARERGLVNVLVTNGFFESEPTSYLLPFIDALNIDIKSMDDGFYQKLCGGALQPVLRFAEQSRGMGCHVEITNLLIPGLNDDEKQVAMLSGWIKEHLGRATPLHLSAYHPAFKMDVPPTSMISLEYVWKKCSLDLDYVYIGNAATSFGHDTYCPECANILVSRTGYAVREISAGACSKCGRVIDFVLPADKQKGKL